MGQPSSALAQDPPRGPPRRAGVTQVQYTHRMECGVAIKNYDIDLWGLIEKDTSQCILLRGKDASGHLIYIALSPR